MQPLSVTFAFVFIFFLGSVASQRKACIRSSCYPATGDLLIGRESQLSSSSTCGIPSPSTYCILSYLVERNASAPLPSPLANQQCFVCDSTKPYFPSYSPNSHRIENVVSKIPRDRNRWWQSANGVHNVSIRLDLEAEFHFTHLIMTFKTFRPAAMYIERSFDFGRTWRPYRYYSSNCLADFPSVSRLPMRRIGDVICSNDYTDMEPSTGGEVIFRAVPSNLQKIDDPYSDEVQSLVKLTNLRIVFTRLHTLGDMQFDSRPQVINNYYFALFELNVRGSCSCYGHAERCVPSDPSMVIDNMVSGKCECTHHTTGMNCHKCKPFYNDLPWKPATIESSNECKKCECNQHATRCHFDAAVFKASGGVSGGVCDDCAHNTQGKNCQECQSFYYQDDSLPLSSPEICKPCNCNPYGSENLGECEQKTDLAAKTIAGRCICKKNAGGKRCDRCKPGYWNFNGKNKDACEKCKCFLPGTFKNLGCHQQIGDCTCKRFVTGEMCDKCMTGFYGLAEDVEEGCKPCECNMGGSKSVNCNPKTGACPCKEGMEGRRCDVVTPGYFVPRIDVLVFEAEDKKSGGTGQPIEIPANLTAGPKTHTGKGGVILGPKDTVDIKISPPPAPGIYEVVIRVHPKEFGSKGWPSFRVKLIRPTVPHPNSFCGRRGAKKEETFLININATFTTTIITTGAVFIPKSICIGPNETVTIRIEANDKTKPNPNARVIIDSILLIPDTSKTRSPDGSTTTGLNNDWLYCRDLLLSLLPTDLPERCKKLLPSIAVSVIDNPTKCDCSVTGSVSSICNGVGGQCNCKPGVTGRKCNRCLPNHFGFGSSGCLPCLCDQRGSHFQQCDPVTGACPCKANAHGRRCNECKVGFWNFPVCLPCVCNRHTDTCDSMTGRCTNCTDYTDGDHCETCRPGYYGDPREGKDIKCKPCLCPGGMDSGIDRSNGCVLVSVTNTAKCFCKKGYDGKRCERCAANYFGNPLDPQSQCRPCDCNNNIDRSVPDSCDSTTGACLKCKYFTKGSNCHLCVDGYYGNAVKRLCKQCTCFGPGTKPGAKQCHKTSGQCDCLPNVVGHECNKCAPLHWNITSGEGCKPCHCTPAGSLHPSCNLFTGQCRCKPGRGGRDCSECQAEFWGQPWSKEGCKPCKCNPAGSKTLQCDRRTGRCVCKPGVAGEFCDRCDRGTQGVFPDCVPCGECWINWFRIITELLNETESFRLNAGKISGGLNLPKNYLTDLEKIESQLQDIGKQLGNKTVASIDLQKLQSQLAAIKTDMKNKKVNKEGLEDLKAKLANNKKAEGRTKALQEELEKQLTKLKTKVDALSAAAIKIKESNLAGAYDTVRDNKAKSDAAQAKVAVVDGEVKAIKARLAATKKDLQTAKTDLEKKLVALKFKSAQLAEAVRKIKQESLPQLNQKVCGGDWKIPYTEDPVCHSACGGGGCAGQRCGGSSVCEGSKDRLKTTERHLDDAERLLNKKMTELGEIMGWLNKLMRDANNSKAVAVDARDEVKKIERLSTEQAARVKKLLKEMQDLLDKKDVRQAELEKLLKEIEGAKSPMTKEEIEKLRLAIETKVNKLKNVNRILQETAKNRQATKNLKKDAEDAKKEAQRMLMKANEIAKTRADALKTLKDAQDQLTKLKDKTEKMESLLKKIESLDKMTNQIHQEIEGHLAKAKKDLNDLENRKKEIETKIKQIEAENAKNAKDAAKINEDLDSILTPKIEEAKKKSQNKGKLANVLASRARQLRARIQKVGSDLDDKLKRLTKAEQEHNVSAKLLSEAEKNLDALMKDLVKLFQETRKKVVKHNQ